MSKPAFPLNGPWPRLSEDLPLNDPRECHQCGVLRDLAIWQESDTADVPEARYIVLCERCSDAIIEPHPRLYRRMVENEPAPGAMPICLNCMHRAGSQCWHPHSWLRGHRGLKLEYPSPFTAICRTAKQKNGSRTVVVRTFPGRVHNCSGTIRQPKVWAICTGPVSRPPEPIKRRGFQGFRYTEDLW